MVESEKLLKWDREHLVHPMCPIGQNIGWLFDKGKGIVFQDTEGNKYIDGLSQLVCLNLGYGRTDILEAMKEQIDHLPYAHQFFGVANATTIRCAQKLAELVPEGLDHFSFTTGGSESIEVAFRFARLYWHNKGKSKYKIISLYDSYHGITFGALSAVGLGKGFFWERCKPASARFSPHPLIQLLSLCLSCPSDGVHFKEWLVREVNHLAHRCYSEEEKRVLLNTVWLSERRIERSSRQAEGGE